MKAKLVRILVIFTCLAMIVPLSGPGSMMAQEQEEGMIQCTSFSRDVLMELTFPEAGGAVQGTYVVSYTAQDTSPLYDSDGTWDYYDEDREVFENVTFSGTYSGGEEGSFSGLRVTGTGYVRITNLEDSRFNRNYRVEMDSPATATWGPGGTLTISGMDAEMVPVSYNANEIPNTEWLEADAVNFPDPTLICTPGPSVQTLEDIACTITTSPPEIGARDTTFEVTINAVGFDPGATLGHEAWLQYGMTDQVVQTDVTQNPTVRWPEPIFADGYYTLQAWVTDGGLSAVCILHFTIGDVEPNTLPDCPDVRIVPAVPPAGFPLLGVLAPAGAADVDGDPLHYNFDLMRGFTFVAESSGYQDPDNHLFSVPGGLQPGPYTVVVEINDGKQYISCPLNFIVPPFPDEDPTGECGPVGIIYLDDEGVEPYVLAIDAFIENALAEGGPDYSLIVSHRQRLTDKFRQEGFEQIDSLLRNMGNIAETCPFLLIVGDHDVVPFPVLPNPTNDGDVLFTDDVYGDTDHDPLSLPDIPVARIPDGNSLDLLLTQVSPSSLPATGDFTVANTEWDYVEITTSEVFGPGRFLLWSLPTRHTDFDPSQVNVRYSYLSLHGSSRDTTVWWGEHPVYPEAFTVAEASSQGIVLSGACYGAYTFNRTPENSITLAFLSSGTRAFVGTTGIGYAPVWTEPPDPPRPYPPTRLSGLFEDTFWHALGEGQAPLAAFMQAKQAMANLVRTGNGTSGDLKLLSEYVYYGKP